MLSHFLRTEGAEADQLVMSAARRLAPLLPNQVASYVLLLSVQSRLEKFLGNATDPRNNQGMIFPMDLIVVTNHEVDTSCSENLGLSN